MVALTLMTALSLSAGLPAPALAEPGPTIAMRAERGQVSSADGTVQAEGDVVLHSGALWLRADTLDYEQPTGRVSAEGNLGLVDGNLVLHGRSASMVLGDADSLRFESATLFQKEAPVSPEAFDACLPQGEGAAGPAEDPAEPAQMGEADAAGARADRPPLFSDGERAAWREAEALAACTPEDFARLGKNALVLEAESIERRGEEFRARALRLTSCSCSGASCPAWSLGASSASVKPGAGALLWWPTFRIRDVPVLIFPLLYVPLSPRRTGLLFPKIEFAGSGGFGADLPFFLTLGQSYDLTFTLGFLTKPILAIAGSGSERESAWGPRGAIEFRYAPALSTSGRVKLSGILDRGFETAGPDRARRGLRGELLIHHRSRFAHGLGISADVAAVSDARYLSDISDNLLASATAYLPSRLRGFWRRGDFELTLATGWFQDLSTARSGFFPSESLLLGPDSPATYQRPALFLAQMPLRRIAGPLQLGAELLVSHLRPIALGGALSEGRLLASVRSTVPADFFALTRIDLAPRLYLPFLRRGPLRAELTAGARGDFSAYTPVLPGAGTSWNDVWARAFADLRLSTEISRIFGEREGERALRHTIAPSLQVRASTREFGNRGADLGSAEALDAIDGLVVPLDELDATSRAAHPRLLQGVAAIRTRLARRNGQELFSLTLGQGFDFTRLKWGETFAQVQTGFHWAAASVGARYDPEQRALTLIQGKLRLTDPRGDYLSLAYDLLRGSGTSAMRAGLDDLIGAQAGAGDSAQFQQINLGVGIAIVRGFSVSYGIRIDPVAAASSDRVLLHSAAIRLKGSCDCWGIDLGAEWAPVSERWSGKVLFTLKNLGSFGN